jgi:3-isopropylmalate dehydratase small subunit
MQELYEGTAWKFGDHVTTDDILPGQYLDRQHNEVGSLVMAGIEPTFSRRIRPGDFIVAGKNFGAGSGRENAIFAIKNAGIPLVIAESFARLFFRNAINNGLIPIILESTSSIQSGHRLRVHITKRIVEDLNTGQVFPIRNLTGTSVVILEAGGIIPFTERRLANRRKGEQQ